MAKTKLHKYIFENAEIYAHGMSRDEIKSAEKRHGKFIRKVKTK